MLSSPYTDADLWLRGNLHAHSTDSDGVRSPEQVAADYAARGYDFLAISDHDTFTSSASYGTDTLLEIPTVEVSSNGPHLLHVDATEAVEPVADRQAVVDAVTERGGLAIPAHPNWKESFDHWGTERLANLAGIAGIEIYNGLIQHHPGAATAMDKWDQLLAAGKRVWGYANDDAHRPWEVANGWNVVQVSERTPNEVMTGLREGRFYASTGVEVERITVGEDLIHVETADATTIRLRSDYGVVQQRVDGPHATFRIPDQLVHQGPEFSYVRIECDGEGTDKAWLQPMFLE